MPRDFESEDLFGNIEAGYENFSLSNPAYKSLAETLTRFQSKTTISTIAGLLTVPAYQTATSRIELLLHLACAHCRGTKTPGVHDLERWLHGVLGELPIARSEDPPEDVFTTNVIASGGNFRIFEGIWEINDRYLQDVLDSVGRTRWAEPHLTLKRRIWALLRLSEAIAERCGIPRWTTTDSQIPSRNFIKSSPSPATLQGRVTFSTKQLHELGIDPHSIAPFMLPAGARDELAKESVGNSGLERRPLIGFGDHLVVACPTAVSPAIRRYVLEWVHENQRVDQLRNSLRAGQRETVIHRSLPNVAGKRQPPNLEDFEQQVAAMPRPERLDVAICAIDLDKVAHIILIHDDLPEIRESGLHTLAQLSLEDTKAFCNHIIDVSEAATKRGLGGMTVVVRGGLGRGALLEFPQLPEEWPIVTFSYPNFETFAWSPGATLLRLWKLQRQVAQVRRKGLVVPDVNGLLNEYAYWVGQEYDLVPVEMSFPGRGLLMIGTNFIHDFRAGQRRLNDVHAVPVDRTGTSLKVRRFHRDEFFARLEARPIYASEDLALDGELAGVVEHAALSVWVWASRPDSGPEAVSFLYRVWTGLLDWLDRLLDTVVLDPRPSLDPIHIRLILADPQAWSKFATNAGEGLAAPPVVRSDPASSSMTVALPFGFLVMFRRPTNDGERALLEGVAGGLVGILRARGAEVSDQPIDELVAGCLGNADARTIHLFRAERPTDHIASDHDPSARLIQPEDRSEWTAGLAWRGMEQPEPSAEGPQHVFALEGKNECNRLLKTIVDSLWVDIKGKLQELDAGSVVQVALANNEEITRDREWWRRTARAMEALHAPADDVVRIASSREKERAISINSGRVLVEMAVTAAARTGGRQASLADLDSLVAAVATLIEIAADSDAIYGDLSTASICVAPNGRLRVDDAFVTGVVLPYAQAIYSGRFREAVDSYDELFRSAEEPKPGSEGNGPFDEPGFVRAFESEFDLLSPGRVIDALAELFDLAFERQTLTVSTSWTEISMRLMEKRRFSAAEVSAFRRSWASEPRENWEQAPKGYRNRDWWPWVFRRRLSIVSRPIVSLSRDDASTAYFGVHQLGASFSYLFHGISSGLFPDEYFRSAEMKEYRGHVVDILGHEFCLDIGRKVESLGWKVRTEVQMSELGAPKELGDLDVVAWRKEDPRLFLIECKRLQSAQTAKEIVELLNRFRGETRDDLGRHLSRVDWVKANIGAVQGRLGLKSSEVEPLLVTNLEVPMTYRSDLPLEPERVGPLLRLETLLRTGRL